MNKFFIKVRYFFIFYRSKFLKKKIYNLGKKSKLEFKNKIQGYNFTTFWFLNNLEIFSYFLPEDYNKSFYYLEIGSYEGMSLLYVLERYKNSKVTSIDLWNDNDIEISFNKNINNYSNLIKIKSDSIIALREFNKKNKKFDYIYIDGLHEGTHVIVDAIEAFKLLDINGIMIFDDFMQDDKNISYQSYEGIFYFLELFKKEIKILYLQNILVLKKK
jgi:hypothetical protein